MTWWTWLTAAAVAAGAGAVIGAALGRWRDDADDTLYRVLPRWWIGVAAAAGAALAVPFFARQPLLVSAVYLIALLWGLTLVHIDLRVRRLPDRLVLPAYPVTAVALLACSVVTGRWSALAVAAASAGVAVAVFTVLALLSPGAGGLGLGDVKLAGVLAALLGWFDWRAAAIGLAAGFVLGGVAAAVLLISRRADRHSHIAFGPAMVAGAYLACLIFAAGSS
jgi:leader peptidase (prepilin peptidase) / N-methyltransferase